MTKLKTVLVLLMACTLPLSAYAGEKHSWGENQHHEKDWSDHHGKSANGIEKMQKHLNLSDMQSKKLEAMFEEKDKQIKPLRKQMHEDKKAIKEMIHNGKMNDSELEILARKIGDAKTKLIIIRSKHRADMLNILTAEQKTKYQKYWSKKSSHRKSIDKSAHSH